MYRLLSEYDGVLRLADRAWIPSSVTNRDWKDYQEWLADGNTPEPAEQS